MATLTTMLTTMLTFDQAQAAVDSGKEFYRKDVTVEGFEVAMFNYMLPHYSSFISGDINLFEMRGLTYVKDGDEWKRFLMLHKFFNVNQEAITKLDVLDKLELTSVSDKLDGSMIRFVRLPNGVVRAKSKMSFESDQAMRANKFYQDDAKLQKLVDESLDNGVCLIFEYTGCMNQIVIRYDKDKLTLLQAREESTGKYLDLESFDYEKTPSVSPIPSLEDLMRSKRDVVGVEGWVARFGDLFVKIKTDWYLSSHKIVVGHKPNTLARLVIEGKIDDFYSLIDDKHMMYPIAKEIDEKLSAYISDKVHNATVLADRFKGLDKLQRKELIPSCKDLPEFKLAMVIVNRGLEFAIAGCKKGLLAETKEKAWIKFSSEVLKIE